MKTGLVLAAACAALFIVGLQSAAGAGPGNVTCTDSFAGTAYDLTVPADSDCELSGATITHDLIEEPNAGVFAHDGVTVGHDAIMQARADNEASDTTIGRDLVAGERTSVHVDGGVVIGRDLAATKPGTVQVGSARVGRDLVINGSPAGPFVFHDICDTTVGRDFRMTDTVVDFGFTIGDTGPNEGCDGSQKNTICHDLVVTGNSALSNDFFGPSSIDVDDNNVAHDLVFSDNTAVPGGYLEVANNSVGHDAICAANSPDLSKDGPDDGQNLAGHNNSCG